MKDQLRDCLSAGTSVLLWGPPGVGKTALVRTTAAELGLDCVTVLASIREPVDFLGLPVLREGEVQYAPPAWARSLAASGGAVLLLDEISTAAPAVQAALLRVVLERVVGELQLPRTVSIVAVANPVDLAAGGWDLSAPLANRVVHLEFQLDPARWAEEFPSYWGRGWEIQEDEYARRARALVAGFIAARPGLLLAVPESLEQRGRAWPSPRSWDSAAKLLAVVMRRGQRPVEAAQLIEGAIGSGAAVEFCAWLRDADLPDPEQVLAEPETFQLPPRGDLRYAVLLSVAAAATAEAGRTEPDRHERWLRGWQVLARACDQGAPDVAAAAARTLARARQTGWVAPAEARRFLPLLGAA